MASIDERLERLTERHEALTQTVELLARQSLENDNQLHQLSDRLGALSQTVETLARQSHLRFEQIASTLESMLQILQNHQRRLEHLEGDSAA